VRAQIGYLTRKEVDAIFGGAKQDRLGWAP
jgi:hypothetical protein